MKLWKCTLEVLFLMLFIQATRAQQATISGHIRDTLSYPLPNANIIAFPNNNTEQTRFTISNEKGEYTLLLKKGINYNVEISYLGFKKATFTISINKDIIKNFILKSSSDKLDEVVVEYKIPIKVKEDTIIYNADAFRSGKERKLKEVLKKMPGIEVDREGNVTAQGKKVTKVLVENKTFFTGNSKLAVNNIPADAVDQIEILNNYNQIAFLKDLEDGDEVAMNIKLKEDMKKFIFGDLIAGGGIEDRYLLHSNLFYYSPDTNINFISDMNNIGTKSFGFKDYIDFEGGFGKLIGKFKSFSANSNVDLLHYLSNNNFKFNKNEFGAFSIRHNISNSTSLNSYVITSSDKTNVGNSTSNIYYNLNDSLIENRVKTGAFNNFFILGKLSLEYEPNDKKKLSSNSFFRLSNNESDGSINTTNLEHENNFINRNSLDKIELKQNIEFDQKFSESQILHAETTFSYLKDEFLTNWLTDKRFLGALIPLKDDIFFDVFQNKQITSTNFNFILKDYWVINNYNHIYTSFGINIVEQNYITYEAQKLSNGTINNFADNGFGNDLDLKFRDIFFGFEYKFLMGIFSIKPGIFFHNYKWSNKDATEDMESNINVLLPQVNIEAEFNSSEKLKFSYKLNARTPLSNRLIRNFTLNSFNSIFFGNPKLENELSHNFSLNYQKFNLYKGFDLNTSFLYKNGNQSYKNSTQLNGINQLINVVMFDESENQISANLILNKRYRNIKIGIQAIGSYNDFFQLVNNSMQKNTSKSISTTGSIDSFFERWPNFEIGYKYEPSIFTTSQSSFTFKNTEFFFNVDYNFLNDFQIKFDYKRVDYRNNSQEIKNFFDISNTSIFYQKEDSAWGFEIEASNIFDARFRRRNSFDDFLISDKTIFIQPRIIMFKINYKL